MNRLRRGIAPAAAIALLLAAGACSDDESVFNAEVGECVESLSDLTGSVSQLPEVDCTDEHEGEIFFLYQHEGDDDEFPGTSALQDEAAEDCTGDEFEDYVGVGYLETEIDVAFITPSEQSWGEGDRETICVLGLPGGRTVDESFEGNGEDFPLSGGGGAGEDFSALVDACEGGDNAACGQLYLRTPVGSEEERIGATCGGRSDEELNGGCVAAFG